MKALTDTQKGQVVKMTTEQASAVAGWAEAGSWVDIDQGADDRIVVQQGNERVAFNDDGIRCCEECGALEGEELQGDCCYSCGNGCDE